MFVLFILLTSTLVTVRARNLNTETIKHHVPAPKYDFSSHEVHFARNGEHEQLSSDGFKNYADRDLHDHGSFNVEFNHRQFPRSENGKEGGQHSGSSVHDYVPELSNREFHNFSMGGFSNIDREHSSRGKKHKDRANHTTSSRDFDLETFESESKIRDSNVEEPRNADRRYKSKTFESNYGVERYSPNFGFGNFEEHFHGNNFGERKSMNRSFNQNNNMQRSNFNSNFSNSRPDFNDRKTDEHYAKDFGVQIQDNERYFDSVASSHNQKSHNNNDRRSQNQSHKQNIELIPTSNFSNRTSARIQHKEKADNEFVTTVAPKHNPRPSSKDNSQMDQRPIFQTSAKPEVTSSKKETNNDVWVWSADSQNIAPGINSTSTEPTVTTPDLDDRAAFTADKCPSGFVRVGQICASVD